MTFQIQIKNSILHKIYNEKFQFVNKYYKFKYTFSFASHKRVKSNFFK